MNKEYYAARREKLRELLHREGLEALIVSHPANRYYLSGFELHDGQCNESSGCLIVTRDGKDWLCTDSRYEEAAASLWERERVFIYRGAAAEEIRELIKTHISGKVGFESSIVSYDFVKRIEPGLELEAADGLVEELRVIKDAAEIKLLEESVQLNHDMLAWLPSILLGNAEAKVAWEIERYFREHGATENSFAPIVAKNEHAALPHFSPLDESKGPTVITENCHVLCDVGARYKQYCSDQTRTFWVGDKPEQRFLDVRDMVREAQQAAIDYLKPGMTGKEVAQVAIDTFKKYGQEEYFTHGLGHGVGLEVHEAPRLSSRASNVLKPNMIVTVEPGLYYPGWGGVRWEYMVVVTEDGCRVL